VDLNPHASAFQWSFFALIKNTLLIAVAFVFASASGAVQSNAATRIQKEFDKWVVTCVEPDENDNRCSLTQTFQGQNQKTKKRVFVFSWAQTKDNDGAEKALLRTTLGADLKTKMHIKFPNMDAIAVDYIVCNRRGCFGEIAFDKAWAREMSSNKTVSVEYNMRNGRAMKLEVDLKGFSEAYAFFQAQSAK
jgi:invasion protein IalB